ncbi:MAG TPA: hypothetical protein VJX10_06060 [Pseudonocardiaceae bacterium]|nr:hypothetical protein [Pseudonocardiaceae bacterium]
MTGGRHANEPAEVRVAKINRSSAIAAAVITGVVTLSVGVITAVATYNLGVQHGSRAVDAANVPAVNTTSATQTTTTTTTTTTPAPVTAPVSPNGFSADGVYVVGQDIPPGTYHTPGGAQCYVAKLRSTNTDDIVDNNNFFGPETVTISSGALQISGGCVWSKR